MTRYKSDECPKQIQKPETNADCQIMAEFKEQWNPSPTITPNQIYQVWTLLDIVNFNECSYHSKP